MATCMKCNAAIPDGSLYCNMCGAKQELSCPNCGAVLPEGSRFCNLCGTPLTDAAPAVAQAEQPKPRRGRPPKAETAAPKKVSYPDVRGFYENRRSVCTSDRAIVFADQSYVYRVDNDMNMCSQSLDFDDVAQTADGILATRTNYDNTPSLMLYTLSDKLEVLSTRTLCELPGLEETDAYEHRLTSDALYLIHYVPVENDEGDETFSDLSFIRIDLESGEKTVWEPGEVCLDGGKLFNLRWCRMLVDGNKLYFNADMLFPGEDEPEKCLAWLTLDFDTGVFTLLWHAAGSYQNYGMPRFFDFKKGIMWTLPREMEMKRRGWKSTYTKGINTSMLPLVPRKIAPNAPILANYQVWEGYPERSSSFTYFDGEKAYYAPDYYNFYAINQGGLASEEWNQFNHGRTETGVLWKNKVIVDMQADYYYTAYPAGFDKPSWDECIKLRD